MSLDEGGQYNLIKIAGGERYHGYFRTPAGANEDPWPEAPAFDWSEGLKAINLVVLKSHSINKLPLQRRLTQGKKIPAYQGRVKLPRLSQMHHPALKSPHKHRGVSSPYLPWLCLGYSG